MQGSLWLLGLAEGDPVAPKEALQVGKLPPRNHNNAAYTTTEGSAGPGDLFRDSLWVRLTYMLSQVG